MTNTKDEQHDVTAAAAAVDQLLESGAGLDAAAAEQGEPALPFCDTADIKIATIGNVDSGKSTLVGVMTNSILDDGRGAARSSVFNFSHESASGRTSSIAQEIMGFDKNKQDLIKKANDNITSPRSQPSKNSGSKGSPSRTHQRTSNWAHIMEHSDKVITFLDLCGHEKYLKTTIFGLVGMFPDYAMIVVNANAGFQKMTREHLGIALALHVPVFVVFTKLDITPKPVADANLKALKQLLNSPVVRRMPVVVKDSKEATALGGCLMSDRVCPIFCVSNVSGEGLEALRTFLRHLTPRCLNCGTFSSRSEPAEVILDSNYLVNGVGHVVGGTVRAGTIKLNDTLLLGPDSAGVFKPVLVRSMQTRRLVVEEVTAGSSATFSIRSLLKKNPIRRNWFRKGMVLVSPQRQPQAFWEFEAEVVILHHSTTIRHKYQAVIHAGTVRQTAVVRHLPDELLRTGDKGKIHFRFLYHAEYIWEGQTFLFREGRTKGLGKIIKCASAKVPKSGDRVLKHTPTPHQIEGTGASFFEEPPATGGESSLEPVPQ